jgi:hypothetical protein
MLIEGANRQKTANQSAATVLKSTIFTVTLHSSLRDIRRTEKGEFQAGRHYQSTIRNQKSAMKKRLTDYAACAG